MPTEYQNILTDLVKRIRPLLVNIVLSVIQSNIGGSITVLHAEETHDDNTWRTLTVGTTGKGLPCPVDTAMGLHGLIVGATANCVKIFVFKIDGSLHNSGGTLGGAGTVYTIDTLDDVNFECQQYSNDTDDTLDIRVRDAGGSSDYVEWKARVETIEITHS